jgi:hypothetical protein
MGFEIVSKRVNPMGLPPGQVSVLLKNLMNIRTVDLLRISVQKGDDVVLLADSALGRIAIRKVRDKEPKTRLSYTKTGATARLWLGSAVSKCGKKIENVAGRYKVMVKGDMLIIDLKDRDSPTPRRPGTAQSAPQ